MRSFLYSLSIFTLSLYGAYAAQPFNDSLVQPLELKSPVRGSIAGDLSSMDLSVSSSQAATGSFHLQHPLSLPELRGTLIHDFRPSYSPSNGQSEWGMGFQSSISIYRFREQGGLDFQTDTFMSPWGLLIQGEKGDYYPKGLSHRVRVRMLNPDTWIAFLPDGSKLTFGTQSALIHTKGRGVYAWYLSEAETALGLKTVYRYLTNASGALFLSEVLYAGREERFQYRVSLTYEMTPISTFDYRSGERLSRDRRVNRIDVQALGLDGKHTELHHFGLSYQDTPQSPRFFLVQIQKIFPSGESEPAVRYHYNDGIQELLGAQWEHLPHLDPLMDGHTALLSPEYSSQLDLERTGLASFETRIGFNRIHIHSDSYEEEAISPARHTIQNYDACRPVNDTRATPRQFIPMRGPMQDYEAVDLYPNGTRTQLLACARNGHLKTNIFIEGSWDLKKLTRLIDLNHSGKPDLIKVYPGGYALAPNESDDSHPYQFGMIRSQSLQPRVEPLGFWVLDMNGDGIPDLVVKTHGGLFIWYGKGNFEFETQAEFREFRSALGRKLDNLGEISFSFADINHDGLMDVFLSTRASTQIFLNNGKAFIEKELPHLKSKLGFINSYPIIADLKGTGNTQVAIFQNGKGYTAELESASTGLLTLADDGKGTVLKFKYQRAAADPGIGQRLPLLAEVTTLVVGQKSIRTQYEYQNPKFHSKLGRLLGYESVTALRGHATSKATYLHADAWASGLLSETVESDTKSHVSRFKRSQFQERDVEGIPTAVIDHEENGWLDASGAKVSTSQLFDVNDHLCTVKTTKNSSAGTLLTETEYATLPQFTDHWTCHPSKLTLTGTHVDPTLNFIHQLKINRNAQGQPVQIMRATPSHDQVAQELTYNTFGELVTSQSPATGQTTYNYDAAHRLSQIVSPEGKTTTVAYEDRDLPRSMHTLRGFPGAEWGEFFNYNELGLLSAQWSSFSGNENLPDATYRYHFANSVTDSLAHIEEHKRLDAGTNETRVWQREIQFFTGAGSKIAQAKQSSSGLSVSGIQALDPENHLKTLLGVKILSHDTDLNTLTSEHLILNTPELGLIQETALGFVHQERQAIQKDVFQLKEYSSMIDPDGLVLNRTENSSFLTTRVQDSAGNPVRYTDESQQNYRYQYDALNRLRKVILPKMLAQTHALNHTVQYDSLGNISHIQRDGVGSVLYQYEKDTGRLKSKTYSDSHGSPIRTVQQTYDSIGRVISTIYQSAPRGTIPEQYFFGYDGKQSDGSVLAGQLGFLTSVRGPGFQKEFRYRADAKILSQTFSLVDWMTWHTSFQYRPDGSVLKKTTQITGPHNSKKTIDRTFGVDSLGRPSTLMVNAQQLLEYQYNDYSELDRIIFAKSNQTTSGLAQELGFGYDEWTHHKNRVSKSFLSPIKDWKTTWSMNDRALIDQETLQDINRSYMYSDPRGFLTASHTPQQSEAFEYDAVGNLILHPTAMQMDTSGRTGVAGSIRYSYNGLGRVSEAVSLPKPRAEYGYDEQGVRIFKRVGGTIREVYQDDSIYDGKSLYEPLKASGMLVDFLKDGQPIGLTTDMRGSVIQQGSIALNLPTVYGERSQRHELAWIADFAAQGFDADLGAYRMANRDYDPASKRFLTPDPLFLEEPERCIDSPHECNLYSYAKGNPVSFVDPSGENAFILLDPKGAGEHGHSALVVGNKDAGYQFMSMGTMGGEFSQVMSGKTFEGIDMLKGTSFDSVVQQAHSADAVSRYTQFIEIPTTAAQDKSMLNYVADRFAQDARTGINYSPITNNCGDFVRDTLNAGGIQTERQMIPNDYFRGVDAKADLPHYSGPLGGSSK